MQGLNLISTTGLGGAPQHVQVIMHGGMGATGIQDDHYTSYPEGDDGDDDSADSNRANRNIGGGYNKSCENDFSSDDREFYDESPYVTCSECLAQNMAASGPCCACGIALTGGADADDNFGSDNGGSMP